MRDEQIVVEVRDRDPRHPASPPPAAAPAAAAEGLAAKEPDATAKGGAKPPSRPGSKGGARPGSKGGARPGSKEKKGRGESKASTPKGTPRGEVAAPPAEEAAFPHVEQPQRVVGARVARHHVGHRLQHTNKTDGLSGNGTNKPTDC